jgi:hypothetical protein
MRCLTCNDGLNDKESTRFCEKTGQYLDTCDICLGTDFLLEEYAIKKQREVNKRLNEIQRDSLISCNE